MVVVTKQHRDSIVIVNLHLMTTLNESHPWESDQSVSRAEFSKMYICQSNCKPWIKWLIFSHTSHLRCELSPLLLVRRSVSVPLPSDTAAHVAEVRLREAHTCSPSHEPGADSKRNTSRGLPKAVSCQTSHIGHLSGFLESCFVTIHNVKSAIRIKFHRSKYLPYLSLLRNTVTTLLHTHMKNKCPFWILKTWVECGTSIWTLKQIMSHFMSCLWKCPMSKMSKKIPCKLLSPAVYFSISY